MSKVETLPENKTVFERCAVCDRYSYEILMPENVCLYCMFNKNVSLMAYIYDIRNKNRVEEIENEYALKTPVTCYLKNDVLMVDKYIGIAEASEALGIARSSIYASIRAEKPTGSWCKSLSDYVYFRKTE